MGSSVIVMCEIDYSLQSNKEKKVVIRRHHTLIIIPNVIWYVIILFQRKQWGGLQIFFVNIK